MTERLRRSRALLLPTLAALLLVLASAQGTRAAWRAAGDVKSLERRADGVVVTLTSGARVAITFITPEVVRVRFAPNGTFERDFSYAVEPRERQTAKATVTETRDEIRISSLMGALIIPSLSNTVPSPNGAPVATPRPGALVLIRRRPFLVALLDHNGRTVLEGDP